MIQTPDPLGIEEPDTDETLELCASFAPSVIAQLQRDTFALYGGWALHGWGFPFRLYAERANELTPETDALSRQLGTFASD